MDNISGLFDLVLDVNIGYFLYLLLFKILYLFYKYVLSIINVLGIKTTISGAKYK